MFDEKEKDYLCLIHNTQKRQRLQIYGYINFLSCKTGDYKDNYLNYRYNISIANENKDINIDEEEIQKRNENFVKFIENELSKLYKDLENMSEFIKNSNKIYLNLNKEEQQINKYLSILKKKAIKSYQNRETLLRTDFSSLIFKNMIIQKEDSIVRDTVKTERKANYFARNKIMNKFPRQNSENERHYNLNDYFKEYIKNNFKENNKLEIKVNILSPSKNNSKFKILPQIRVQQINNSIYYNTSQAHINVKSIPFNIILSFNLNKELVYNNHKFSISLKDEYDSPSHSDLILFKKVKCLLYERIKSILNLIYEEKRRKMNNTNNNNIILFDEEILKDFIIRFINYIYDFNIINKTKCYLCQNIVKFSENEKCFLPPFYKAYKEKEALLMNSKNENENEPKLFYHEDCFRKIAGSFL